MRFECLKCADCCANLLHKEQGVITGLSLTTEEASLFPQEHIFPSIGIGHYGRSKKVIAFQLDLNTCPYIQGKRCGIYTNRPLACRAYPFGIQQVKPLRSSIDENCRWFKERVVAKGLQKKLLRCREEIIASEEIEASLKIFKILSDLRVQKNKWWFDLGRKAWFTPASKRRL